MKIRTPEMKKARIEIIPMIDTIFFLLVFFMIASLSMVKMKGMSVALPRNAPAAATAASGQGGQPANVILTVTDQGSYYLNTSPIDPGALAREMQARVNSMPNTTIVLNVAKTQSQQSLIRILDTLAQIRDPGGQQVKALIATEPVDVHGRALLPGQSPLQ